MSSDAPISLQRLVTSQFRSLRSPFQWNATHLGLVGCRWEDINTARNPQDTLSESKDELLDYKAMDSKGVACDPRSTVQSFYLTKILTSKEGAFLKPKNGSSFYFQGRAVHKPDYKVFHRRKDAISMSPSPGSDSSSPPLVGYVHYADILHDRIGYCQGKKLSCAWGDPPSDKDPYYLCHLFALAQLQDRMLQGKPRPEIFISRLLIHLIWDGSESIFIYEAQIPRELLDGLKNLTIATTPMKWPTIRRTKIPFRPYKTFSSRLIAELVGPAREPSREPNGQTNGQTNGSNSDKRWAPKEDDSDPLQW